MKGLLFTILSVVVVLVLCTKFISGSNGDTMKTETERLGTKAIANMKLVESGQ